MIYIECRTNDIVGLNDNTVRRTRVFFQSKMMERAIKDINFFSLQLLSTFLKKVNN